MEFNLNLYQKNLKVRVFVVAFRVTLVFGNGQSSMSCP